MNKVQKVIDALKRGAVTANDVADMTKLSLHSSSCLLSYLYRQNRVIRTGIAYYSHSHHPYQYKLTRISNDD